MERSATVGGSARIEVEAQGSLFFSLESAEQRVFGEQSSPLRTSLTFAFTKRPLPEQVQSVCDQLGVPYDSGESCCVLVQGRSPADPLVLSTAQLLAAPCRSPLSLWRLSDLAHERLELLLEAGGAGAASSLRGLLAACAEPRFAPELIRQEGLPAVLEATLHGGEASGLAVSLLCELCRHDEARGWLDRNAECISEELLQQLLALIFPPSVQGRRAPSAPEAEAAPSGPSAGAGRAALRRTALCLCLWLLKELPQQTAPAMHRAAAQVEWPEEPAYLRMARALDSEDLGAADAALAALYALETAAESSKQLRAQVREELAAALSSAGQWQPRAVQWMFADTAVKNRLAWSRWKGLADAIAELVGYGKKPEFMRPVRMKITGVRQTGEEEVRSLTAKKMSDAIDQLTEMFAQQQSEERAPRRVRFRRQHQDLPPGRDAHVLRHLLASTMASAPGLVAPSGEAVANEATGQGGRHVEQLLEDADRLKSKVRRQHLALCRMASFVRTEGCPQVQEALEEIVRSGWDSMTWDGNHSLLHEVAKNVDDPGVVELVALLATDVERRDDSGKRPVDYARERADSGVVGVLERIAGPDGGGSPLRKRSAHGGSFHSEATPPGAPSSSPRASGSRRARDRSVEELGLLELRGELERTRAELERAQAPGYSESAVGGPGADGKGLLGGPLNDEALQRYAQQVQAYGREAVRNMLQRPSFCGGLGLGELDAGRAMAQLDMALRVVQAMSPAVGSTAPASPSPPPRSSREGFEKSPAAEVPLQEAVAVAEAGNAGPVSELEGALAPPEREAEEEATPAPPAAPPPAAPPPKPGGKAAAAKGEGKGPSGKGKAPGPAPPPAPVDVSAAGSAGPAKGGKGAKGVKGPPGKGSPPPKAKSGGGAPEPNKPDIRLDAEMKPLYWKKLVRTAGTIWADIGDDRELLPAEVVTHWFRKVAVTNTKRHTVAGQAAGSPLCVITDARTKTSREISLRILPPPSEVARALREVDASALLPEDSEPGLQLESQLERVSAGVPDQKQKQELEAARAAEPDRPLGLIESYMWELSRIPACSDRLKCWIYVHSVMERVQSLCTRLRMFEEILGCFRSQSLQRLLGLFLAVGNYLNAGTREGRADGFDLETLKKLDSVKDSQGRDIRHFVMGLFLKHFKDDARQLLKDFRPVLKSVLRKVDQKDATVEFRKQVASLESYTDDIHKFQEEYRAKKEILSKVLAFIEDDADAFTVKMSEEFRRAGQGVEELVTLRKQLVEAYGEVLAWFAASSAPKNATFLLAFDAQMEKDRKGGGGPDPSRCFPRSDDFILLWDNLLIPPELIERKPWLPDVKYKLGPRFCKAREITVDDLEDLWETSKMMVDQGGDRRNPPNSARMVRRKTLPALGSSQ